MQEESCTYCGHALLDLAVRAEAGRSRVSCTLRVEKTLCWLFRSSKRFSSRNVASGTSALLTRRGAASLFRRA